MFPAVLNPPAVVWGAMVGICLATAGLHLGIWLRGNARAGLHFMLVGVMALAVACIGYFEIRLMTLQSPGEGLALLRWAHVYVFVLMLSMALFVHVHFGTGRLWLLGAALAARVAVVIANFASDGNIHHLAETSLRTVPFLWGHVTLAGGVPNPWGTLVPLATLVFVAYVVDASVRLWRVGDASQRRRAALIGGSIVSAVAFSTAVSVPKQLGILDWPFMVTPAFLFVVLAVGYELMTDVLLSAELAERLQATRGRLQLAEERLRMATLAAGVGIWEWDRTRDSFHLSEASLKVLGLGPSETIATADFYDRIGAEDVAKLRLAIEQAATAAGELNCDVQVRDRNGQRRWVALRGSHVGDSAGAAPLLRGVLADVTERRESDERLNVVAQASPIGVIMVSRDGLVLFANKKVETVFGYEPGELLGKPADMLVPHTLRERHASYRSGPFLSGVARAMQEGRDVVGIRKDGSDVVVAVSLVQVQLNGEQVALASVIDQGWRRDAERELARQRDELAYLSRAALLGELSGSLAHELNQPLTAILSNSQAAQQLALRGRLDKGTLDEILVDIVRDTRRAGDVIQRLRTLLRHGRSTMERVDLEAICQEVLRLMGSDLIRRRVTVHTTFAPGLPQVVGDRVQLQQVVLNLLLNACEAMAEEFGPRQILVGTQLDTEGRVRFYVEDEGPGIPEDVLGRVFEPFVTTKAEGLGLGLSLCRTIIEHHNGKIVAANNATRGATFDFRLQPAPQQP